MGSKLHLIVSEECMILCARNVKVSKRSLMNCTSDKCIPTYLFHFIPVTNDPILYGMLQSQDPSHMLSLITDVGLPFKVTIDYFLKKQNISLERLARSKQNN